MAEEITFGDKGVIVAEGSGSIKLRCETPTGESLVTLQNAKYVPAVAANLVSVSKATKAGAKGGVCRGVAASSR